MISMVDKNLILLRFFRDNESKSSISRSLKISRKTVRRYINEHLDLTKDLPISKSLEEGLTTKPRYSNTGRPKRKLTQEISQEIKLCLKKNQEKLGQGLHKQQMKKIDIHEYLLSKGHEIGYTTVCNYIREFQSKTKEAYIKQVYHPGEICEFDWGEVKIKINGVLKKFNIAVFTSAYSNYRYSKLFSRQDTLAFVQSHIDFFSHTKGVYGEMVYDNMRVAVLKFVGPTEKRATQALLEMSNYYKFKFRFCNIRKGNEKGHVERSVEYVRRKAFCIKDEFYSLERANEHLLDICKELNNKVQQLAQNQSAYNLFEEEKKYLYKTEVPYKCFKEEFSKTDKYATIIVYKNRYSVPDYLVGKLLNIRVFAEKIVVYLNDEIVCRHPRSYAAHSWTIDINHYLTTLKKKPGALKGSLAFDNLSEKTKSIYNQYFLKNTKDFIELLQYLKDKSLNLTQIEKAIQSLQKIAPSSINKDTILAVIDSQKQTLENKSRPAIQGCDSKKELDEIQQYAKKTLEEISQLTH